MVEAHCIWMIDLYTIYEFCKLAFNVLVGNVLYVLWCAVYV